MTVTVYDTAGNAWPGDTQYALCYLNGFYANVGYVRQHFPNAKILTIDVTGTVAADMVDVESGDANAALAAAGLKAGRYRMAYASMSTADEIAALMDRPWQLFAADPTGVPHFPAAPAHATVVGCQYAWAALNQTGGRNIDISVALESLFGITPPPPPPTPPVVPLDPNLELIVSLATSPTDALNFVIRDKWATYRTDGLSVLAQQYLQAVYSLEGLDATLACIIDTAQRDGHLRPMFAGAA